MNIIEYTPQLILDDINKKNGLTLKAEDIIMSFAEPSTGTWLEENGLGNTLVRITATESSKYTGNVVVAYDRVDINYIAALLGNHCGLPETVTTVHAALPYFAARHGILLHPEDFEDGVVSWTEIGASFTIRAKAESLIWVGEAAFTSNIMPEELANIVTNTDLPEYDILRETSDKFFAETFVYSIDFTDHFDALSSMSALDFDLPTLVDIINQETSAIDYNLNDNVGDWKSLFGATITYNGMNSGIGIANPNYKYVLKLKVREDSTVSEGELLLHYNDPIEEPVA